MLVVEVIIFNELKFLIFEMKKKMDGKSYEKCYFEFMGLLFVDKLICFYMK